MSYEVHQETYTGSVEMEEVLGEIDIPDDAIGVNTTATASNPPIVTVTWLEPADKQYAWHWVWPEHDFDIFERDDPPRRIAEAIEWVDGTHMEIVFYED